MWKSVPKKTWMLQWNVIEDGCYREVWLYCFSLCCSDSLKIKQFWRSWHSRGGIFRGSKSNVAFGLTKKKVNEHLFGWKMQTGTGFIMVENANGNTFNIGVDSATDSSHVYKGNPATNDWIPSAVDEVCTNETFCWIFEIFHC